MTALEIIRVDAPDPRATVVLLHGASHGAWCWQDGFAQRLATRGISTLAASLRGHGGSAIDRPNDLTTRIDVLDVATRSFGKARSRSAMSARRCRSLVS
jgi:alpha-beta hydrolase superfamily lysophospholipase